MVDPRAKGAKAETVVRDTLRKYTNLGWERVPGSGALDAKHGLKGDLYVPNEKNIFCVECKHYAEDHLTSKILSSVNPQLLEWWQQAVRQSVQVTKKPLLIFKHDRSKLFVAFTDMPSPEYTHIFISHIGAVDFYVSLLEDWLTYEKPKFIE